MTLAFRNSLLTFLLTMTILITAFFFATSVILIQTYGWGAKISSTQVHFFWFAYAASLEASLSSNLISIGLALICALGAQIYFRQVFRKTTSPEIFFVSVFFFALSTEGLRILQIFVSMENASYFLGLMLTRVVYLFRIFSVLALLAGSLYVLDFQYQKYGTVLGLTFLLSLLTAAAIPMDTGHLNTNLLYGLADERGLGYFFIIFELIVAVNFVLASVTKKSVALAWIGLAVLLIMAGGELTRFNQIWSPVLFVPSVILLGRKTQEIYLWT